MVRQVNEASVVYAAHAELQNELEEEIQALPLQGKPPKKLVDKVGTSYHTCTNRFHGRVHSQINLLRLAAEAAADDKINLATASYDVVRGQFPKHKKGGTWA